MSRHGPQRTARAVAVVVLGMVVAAGCSNGSRRYPAPDGSTGDVSIGIVQEHDPVAALTYNIRVCVTPVCPPPCP